MNAAFCHSCQSIIESTYRHEFVECACRDVFVDGGEDYSRRGWIPGATWDEITNQEELEEALALKLEIGDNNA